MAVISLMDIALSIAGEDVTGELLKDLVEVVIYQSLASPAAFRIVLRDPGLEWSERGIFSIGTKLGIDAPVEEILDTQAPSPPGIGRMPSNQESIPRAVIAGQITSVELDVTHREPLLFVDGVATQRTSVAAEPVTLATTGQFARLRVCERAARDMAVTIRSQDPATGQEIIATADGTSSDKMSSPSDQSIEVRWSPVTQQAAADLARSIRADLGRLSVEIGGVITGMAMIPTGTRLLIQLAGKRYEHTYLVTRATHSIDAAGSHTLFHATDLSLAAALALSAGTMAATSDTRAYDERFLGRERLESRSAVRLETPSGRIFLIDDTDHGIMIQTDHHSIMLDDSGRALTISTQGDLQIKAGGIISIQGDGGVEVHGAAIDIQSQATMNLQANATLAVKSSAVLNIQGSLVKIN